MSTPEATVVIAGERSQQWHDSLHAVFDGLVHLETVDHPHFQWVDFQRLCHVVHVRLVGKADLRGAESTHRAGHRLVRVDDERFGVEVVDDVGPGREDAGLAERRLAP